MDVEKKVMLLYNKFGQSKTMPEMSVSQIRPYFFLHRKFLGEQDLLIIFNTKRCRYQCYFCDLPQKSSLKLVPDEDILAQFDHVVTEMKHSLSVLDRLTISNNGSVLDVMTFSKEALLTIVQSTYQLPQLKTLVFETRLEFAECNYIEEIKNANPRVTVDILTGFETKDPYIRENILHKEESLDDFLTGLDKQMLCRTKLTAYVLFKPSPFMTDKEAITEAEESIDFLVQQCAKRHIDLTIRLNPMYAARGSKWSAMAKESNTYAPPRLTDILNLARRKADEGVNMYIGLSTESLEEPWGYYRQREDYSRELLKQAILFNNRKIC